jgi:hypothetical protein
MDFIERIFHLSPDGGDGTFEFMLFAIPIAMILAVVYWQRKERAAD